MERSCVGCYFEPTWSKDVVAKKPGFSDARASVVHGWCKSTDFNGNTTTFAIMGRGVADRCAYWLPKKRGLENSSNARWERAQRKMTRDMIKKGYVRCGSGDWIIQHTKLALFKTEIRYMWE